MQAEAARRLAHLLSPPGRLARALLGRLEPRLRYPSAPTVVPARGGFARFEIRDFHEFVQREIYFLGYWELELSRHLRRLLRPGDTFIDIGANLGWFTLLGAALVGEAGRVIAFEPCTSLIDHLRRNVALNGFEQVTIEPVAVAAEEGEAVLNIVASSNLGMNTLAAAPDAEASETVTTIPYDVYAARHEVGPVRLVKIDAEGAEHWILQGMAQSLAERRIGALLVEVDDERLRSVGSGTAELLDRLRGLGYTVRWIKGMRLIEPDVDALPRYATMLAERR